MLVLYIGLIRDYLAHGYCIYISATWLCRLHSFLFYFALDFSSWILVAVSIDRFLAITFVFSSYTRNILLKVFSNPKLVCSIIGLCLFFLNLHFLFYIESVDSNPISLENNFTIFSIYFGDDKLVNNDSYFSISVSGEYSSCVINEYKHPIYSNFFQNTWPYIDLSAYAIAPFIIMAVCNVAIIKNAKFSTPSVINRSKKKRFCLFSDKNIFRNICNHKEEEVSETNVENDETNHTENSIVNNSLHPTRKRSSALFTRLSLEGNSNEQSQARNIRIMTLTITSITCIFILLTLPVVLFIVIEKITIEMNKNKNETLETYSFLKPDDKAVVWSIINILMYINHSINFVLYCLTGSKFRAELATLLVSEKKLAKLNFHTNEYPALNTQIMNKSGNTKNYKSGQCNKVESVKKSKSIFCGSAI
jgi:hypothetical protein